MAAPIAMAVRPRLTELDFRFTWCCQDHTYDVISIRKVLPPGECTRTQRLSRAYAAVSASYWSGSHDGSGVWGRGVSIHGRGGVL